MIVCTKHRRQFTASNCPLQERVTAALHEAQRGGDKAAVVLIDFDDPEHIAVATIGTTEAFSGSLAFFAGVDADRMR